MEPALYRLPNELLHQILVHVAFEPAPSDANSSFKRQQYFSVAKDLRNPALTSKRLATIAQEHLFRSPYVFDDRGQFRPPQHAPFMSLLRPLLDRPELAHNVRALCLGITGNFEYPVQAMVHDEPSTRILQMSESIVLGSHFEEERKVQWLRDLGHATSGPLAGVILHLLTNVRHLEILLSQGDFCDTFGPMFGEYTPYLSGSDAPPQRVLTLEGMGSAPVLQTLKSLRIQTTFHPNLYGLGCLALEAAPHLPTS
jgi:hypothetical protein